MALWNSRFKKQLAKSALKFSSSIEIDGRLFNEDIDGSIAHIKMLSRQKIISTTEEKKIIKALEEIRKEITEGKLKLDWEKEDIHSLIEERLVEKIGETGKKLHTARSRNDQIALDERLYLRKEIKTLDQLISSLQKTLLKLSEEYRDTIIPGYTHLQRAQPILFAHHLLAYIEMLQMDKGRLNDILKRVNKSPLGAAAFAGTSLPIDRKFAAQILKMDGVIENSINAVSNRDELIEFLSACSIIMMHLSRLSEELILWSTKEFSFAFFDDEYATGSSLMPQKKNPDFAELIRAKTGRVYGSLIGLLTVMKALPLSYNRDMQEDKFYLFNAVDTTKDSLSMMTELLEHTYFNKSRFDEELRGDLSLATDLVDYFVRKNVPFRKAHYLVGKVVSKCLEADSKLHQLSIDEYKKISSKFDNDIYALFNPGVSIKNKKSLGSTSPEEVKKQINKWKKVLYK